MVCEQCTNYLNVEERGELAESKVIIYEEILGAISLESQIRGI